MTQVRSGLTCKYSQDVDWQVRSVGSYIANVMQFVKIITKTNRSKLDELSNFCSKFYPENSSVETKTVSHTLRYSYINLSCSLANAHMIVQQDSNGSIDV